MKRALVIGSPVAQARSPLLHSFWLKEYGIAGEYGREEVQPEHVAEFLRNLPARGYAGCNVTIPDKEAAFHACTHTTSRASALEAVNTIWFENGEIWGDNTDGLGFVAHLDAVHPGWDETNRHILLLGAGGGARGLAMPLLERKPLRLAFSNRSEDRLGKLLADLKKVAPHAPVDIVPWDAKDGALADFDLVINTTSLGMQGKEPLSLDLSRLPAHAIVADIVYVPLETPLLAAAKSRGLRTLDGLGMLLHQAVPGFEKWFGRKPEVTEALRAHIVAHLPK
ncbi:MAG: shikimate dehydrogenase [Beijerinckiaceae bacterium]|jgi:shikimate dehydrogenase|nr:shikimate dehydrogenase [Beijerinckiaceae bacterium]